MDESVLDSIKELLGIKPEYTYFDPAIIMHINSVMLILNQLGVGPATPYHITGRADLWTDFISDITSIEAVKTYVYCKVKLIFDPPTSSSLLDSLKRTADEFEWRLNIQVDPGV